MDIIPISTKVLGRLGEGITHTLVGVYIILTGCDEDGRQMHEFGSSEGILSEQIAFGKAGTPREEDILIHIDMTVKGGLPYERELPLEIFKKCDEIIQEIRLNLKELDGRNSDSINEYFDKIKENSKKVVLIKQVAGQGAMYDNLILAKEPSGISGGVSVIDIKNIPIVLSPNEFRDGALRSMT